MEALPVSIVDASKRSPSAFSGIHLELQGLTFFAVTNKKIPCEPDLSPKTLGCKRVGTTPLPPALSNIVGFHEPAFHRFIQAIIRLADTHTERASDFALAHASVCIEDSQQLESSVVT
jgi:hypothetical protein